MKRVFHVVCEIWKMWLCFKADPQILKCEKLQNSTSAKIATLENFPLYDMYMWCWVIYVHVVLGYVLYVSEFPCIRWCLYGPIVVCTRVVWLSFVLSGCQGHSHQGSQAGISVDRWMAWWEREREREFSYEQHALSDKCMLVNESLHLQFDLHVHSRPDLKCMYCWQFGGLDK